MSESWLHFAIVVFVQLIIFIIHAYYEKKLSDVPRILGWGILIGIVVGLPSDLILGKFFGLWSYTLGFGPSFLSLNAALVYGVFAANTLLMQRSRLLHFFIWTMVVMAFYEITNHFFRAWTYHFSGGEIAVSPFEFWIGLAIGYFGTAILIAAIWHVFLGHRFFFITNLLKK